MQINCSRTLKPQKRNHNIFSHQELKIAKLVAPKSEKIANIYPKERKITNYLWFLSLKLHLKTEKNMQQKWILYDSNREKN